MPLYQFTIKWLSSWIGRLNVSRRDTKTPGSATTNHLWQLRLSLNTGILLIGSWFTALCQTYSPTIEWTKPVPADARLIVKAGYLVVPENRHKVTGSQVKLPFYFIRRPDQHPTKNISLYMVGGPGYSTTAGINSIGYEFGYLKFGGMIMFGQRGTKTVIPCLDCIEMDEAIRQSLRKGQSRDALVLAAVKQCRARLIAINIDLSAYTTLESAEDINDLRLALKTDSLNLIGLSYSGGLMLTVSIPKR